MTKLAHSLGFKILAVLLVIFSALTGTVSITAVALGGNDGFYNNTPISYYNSSWCTSTAYSYANRAFYHYTDSPDNTEHWLSTENSNFAYEIFDQSGVQVAQSPIPENVGYTENFSFYTSTTYQVNAGEFEPVSEPLAYQVKAYVSEPLTASDDFALAYRLYTSAYELRYVFIGVAFFSVVIFFASLMYLLCAAGHRPGRDTITLNLQDKIPLELYFGIELLLSGFAVAATSPITFPLSDVGSIIFLLFLIVYVSSISLAVIMTIATRLKMGKWWQNSISYWVLKGSWKF